MAYNAGKKIHYGIVCGEKNSITGGLGEKLKLLPKPINLRSGPILAVLIHSQPDLTLTQTKSHVPPSNVK